MPVSRLQVRSDAVLGQRLAFYSLAGAARGGFGLVRAGPPRRPHLPPPLPAPCPACSYLAPADLAAAAVSHKAWRLAVVQEEGLWRDACEAEFSLTAARAPDRQPLPSFHAAFCAWRASFGRYGPLAGRALRAWRQVEEWSREHFPDVARSLR